MQALKSALSHIFLSGALCRSLLAELVGSLLLVLVGCGSCMGGDQAEPASQLDDQVTMIIWRATFLYYIGLRQIL